ncbi:anthranilate synthase component I [Helicobacter sp. 16-1353]|uniref:chorismate-binding protein n=1 Tax=Helicobacter sp. 16-1353 TaxID=2004996 RepID=UPI000DCDD305|nr:chorismate-binding protein [Helicobacter sp. 16-1353]RAX54999.1 anthranilate synthase component I [Helicobacter sp. 16-1353]
MDKRNDAIYEKLSSDRYTPFSLAFKLGAKAILESASFSHGKERYSILMVEEAFKIFQDKSGVWFIINGEKKPANLNVDSAESMADSATKAESTESTTESRADSKDYKNSPDILDILSYIAAQNKRANNNIPLPASGIGYLGYEFCAKCDTIVLETQTDSLEIPESIFIVGHIYIIFDHFSEELHIFGLNYNEHEIDLNKAIERLKKRINDLDFSYLQIPVAQDSGSQIAQIPASQDSSYPVDFKILTDIKESKSEFIAQVLHLKECITNGDLLQAVPSRRLQIQCEIDALEAYRRLRLSNPSPYLFYINFGDFEIVGASPESLVRVRGGNATIRPIAGTRRRGKNDAEDERLKLELLSDEKEKAEHLMLVDLARNDLGKVCEIGSVEVVSFMQCEVFSHVIHLVSQVNGKVKKDISSMQVLRSSFPAGTVSGAPKIRAIELLSSIEKTKRNFYAGAIGYVDIEGGLDFCIAIRCALRQENIWNLQAGAGIVYDSIPEREWEETNEKLNSMISVLTQALNPANALANTMGEIK